MKFVLTFLAPSGLCPSPKIWRNRRYGHLKTSNLVSKRQKFHQIILEPKPNSVQRWFSFASFYLLAAFCTCRLQIQNLSNCCRHKYDRFHECLKSNFSNFTRLFQSWFEQCAAMVFVCALLLTGWPHSVYVGFECLFKASQSTTYVHGSPPVFNSGFKCLKIR